METKIPSVRCYGSKEASKLDIILRYVYLRPWSAVIESLAKKKKSINYSRETAFLSLGRFDSHVINAKLWFSCMSKRRCHPFLMKNDWGSLWHQVLRSLGPLGNQKLSTPSPCGRLLLAFAPFTFCIPKYGFVSFSERVMYVLLTKKWKTLAYGNKILT